MMKRRTRQHETINQRHRNAYVDALRERPQHADGLRAMKVHLVFGARVAGRNNKRPALNRKANMTDEAFVQDAVNQLSIKDAALRLTFECCALGYRKSVHGSRD